MAPSSLDQAQGHVYEEIVGGPRAAAGQAGDLIHDDGTLAGPFNAMLLAPNVGLHLQRLGSALRYETSLPDAAREVAILLCARAERSEFEWHVHAKIARAVGVPDETLDAILEGRKPDLGDSLDEAVVSVVASLLAPGDLLDDDYRAASAELTDAQLVELCILIGYYRLLSSMLRVFRVPLPAGAVPQFDRGEDVEPPTE